MPLGLSIKARLKFSSQWYFSWVFLAVKADSPFGVFVELLVNVIPATREMVKRWGENMERLACSITNVDFGENGLSTVLSSVLAKMKSGDYMFIKHTHVENPHSHFVQNCLGLFLLTPLFASTLNVAARLPPPPWPCSSIPSLPRLPSLCAGVPPLCTPI